jgi:hypothetical protein
VNGTVFKMCVFCEQWDGIRRQMHRINLAVDNNRHVSRPPITIFFLQFIIVCSQYDKIGYKLFQALAHFLKTYI